MSYMLLDELHAKKTQIEQLSRQFGAKRVRVFGSVARREDTPDSDIDFIVDFPKGYDLFSQRLPLTEQLKIMLNREVELIPEHEVNPHMREQIFAEAVEL